MLPHPESRSSGVVQKGRGFLDGANRNVQRVDLGSFGGLGVDESLSSREEPKETLLFLFLDPIDRKLVGGELGTLMGCEFLNRLRTEKFLSLFLHEESIDRDRSGGSAEGRRRFAANQSEILLLFVNILLRGEVEGLEVGE